MQRHVESARFNHLYQAERWKNEFVTVLQTPSNPRHIGLFLADGHVGKQEFLRYLVGCMCLDVMSINTDPAVVEIFARAYAWSQAPTFHGRELQHLAASTVADSLGVIFVFDANAECHTLAKFNTQEMSRALNWLASFITRQPENHEHIAYSAGEFIRLYLEAMAAQQLHQHQLFTGISQYRNGWLSTKLSAPRKKSLFGKAEASDPSLNLVKTQVEQEFRMSLLDMADKLTGYDRIAA